MVVTIELIKTTIPSQSQENTSGNITIGQKNHNIWIYIRIKMFKKYKQEDMK